MVAVLALIHIRFGFRSPQLSQFLAMSLPRADGTAAVVSAG